MDLSFGLAIYECFPAGVEGKPSSVCHASPIFDFSAFFAVFFRVINLEFGNRCDFYALHIRSQQMAKPPAVFD